uniref:MsrB domain-containing protein n=1 Tax=Alexandrium catenella TaxID=2925 RepID=A0A7S1WL09_ALECA
MCLADGGLRQGVRPGTPVPTTKPLIQRRLSSISELSELNQSFRGGARSSSVDALPRGQPSPKRVQGNITCKSCGDLSSRGVGAGGDDAWWTSLTPEQARVEKEWQAKLTALQFRVLRMKGTEEINSGPLLNWFAAGSYACAGCGAVLYRDEHKIPTTCGWPAFKDSIPNALRQQEGKKVPEIVCRSCEGHMGHIFTSERYPLPHHVRHCVNSASLKFLPASQPAEPSDQRPLAAAAQSDGSDEED